MNLKNQPPIFVPEKFQREIEKLSKAALMDLVWDLAATSLDATNETQTMDQIRDRAAIVLIHRKQDRAAR